jgi:hypothetical protein
MHDVVHGIHMKNAEQHLARRRNTWHETKHSDEQKDDPKKDSSSLQHRASLMQEKRGK